MVGAPQTQETGNPGETSPGILISVLDACLLNGFNTQSLDSLTYDSGTGEATGTVSAGHGFLKYQVILVEGANEPAFNGDQRVTFVDATTFKFTTTQIPPATATGTITAKAAPIGQWEKAFSVTNKAAYRSVDPLATGFYLRVDDTVTNDEKPVIAYESMTNVDTGTNQFGLANSSYFGLLASATDKWALVGDSRFFYLYAMNESNPRVGGMAAFGDINSFKPTDVYHCVLIASQNKGSGNPPDGSIISKLNSTQTQWRIARSYNTTTLNPQVSLFGTILYTGNFLPTLAVNPNPSDGNFYINESPILVVADNDLRGTLPGLGLAYNDLGLGFHIIDKLSNHPDAFLVLQDLDTNTARSQAAFNLTGSWR
jgi:hypothetical protein